MTHHVYIQIAINILTLSGKGMGTSLLLRGFDGFLAAGAFFLGLVMAGTRAISFVAIASDAVAADGLTVDECEYAAAEGLFRSKSCRSAAVRYDWEGGPLLKVDDADVAEFL